MYILRYGDYKLVAGFPGLYPVWYPVPGSTGDQAAADRVKIERHNAWMRKHIPGEARGAALREAFKKSIDANAPIFYYLFNLKGNVRQWNTQLNFL